MFQNKIILGAIALTAAGYGLKKMIDNNEKKDKIATAEMEDRLKEEYRFGNKDKNNDEYNTLDFKLATTK